jgi:FkbM family methyltransferase
VATNDHAESRRGNKFRDRVSTGIFELISLLRLRKTIKSDGKSWPWPRRHYVRKVNRSLFGLRQRLTREIEIQDGNSRFVFACKNYDEFSRCMKMFIKEPGTCNWIKNEVLPGQIFYDIGANIGVYTLLAAQCVGGTGKVFAFEPHSANLARLLGNIVANNLQHLVIPCSLALHGEDGFLPFRYRSCEAGSSGSALKVSRTGSAVEPETVVSELKYAVSIDNLIASGRFPPPHHVKIDVDGNELLILRGMTKLLRGADRPRSVQVEINKGCKTDMVTFMEDHRYRLTETHHTRHGLELVARGAGPDDHCHNAIFRPQDSNV